MDLQTSPSTGKQRKSPRYVAMPLKRKQSDPEAPQSMNPEEKSTPPNSPEQIPTPPYPITGESLTTRPIAMLKRSASITPESSTMSTPSSFRLGELYRTPVQTIIEVEDELMEEGETTNPDSPREEGQIADTRQSTLDSMDIGIPCVPSDWLQPSSP